MFHDFKVIHNYGIANGINYGINNIRDLVGHKVNLKMVYENPICRIHK